MAQKFQGRFRQEGTKIDHTPSSAVSAGDVVVQTSLVGVAHADIAASAQGALQVAGVVDMVKITGAVAAGVAVFWDATGDPVGGTSGTGAMTATSSGNTFIGFMVSASLSGDEFGIVYMVPAVSVTAAGNAQSVVADPGASGAIPITGSGSCAIVSVGVETRTLADPAVVGSILSIYFKTDGGTITLTSASPMNQTGNNTWVAADEGDQLTLIAVEDGADKEWRVLEEDGGVLSTV